MIDTGSISNSNCVTCNGMTFFDLDIWCLPLLGKHSFDDLWFIVLTSEFYKSAFHHMVQLTKALKRK